MQWQRYNLSAPKTNTTDNQYELVSPQDGLTTFSNQLPQQPTHEKGSPNPVNGQLHRYHPGSVALDVFLIVACTPFLLLMGLVLQRDGRTVDESDWGRIQQGMSISVTAFPLVFSAVAGTLVHRFAAWKLERGSSIMTLEQLNGCSTLINTLHTLVSLRAANILGLVLIVLWAVSPLGGQSSLYILRTRPSYGSEVVPVSYFNSTRDNLDLGASGMSSYFPFASSLFMASILAPEYIKASTNDNWGYVKIPQFETIASGVNASGWAELGDQPANYSSLLGIPIVGLDQPGNITLRMKAAYFDLELINSTGPDVDLRGIGFSVNTHQTEAVQFQPIDSDYQAYFNLIRVFADTEIVCNGDTTPHKCAVTAMRKLPDRYNALDRQRPTFWVGNVLVTLNQTSAKRFSSTEAYLINPEAASVPDYANSTITRDDLIRHLAQLINTYSLSYYDPAGFFRGAPRDYLMANTTAVRTYFDGHRTYDIFWPWMIVFIIASITMLLCALVSAALTPLTVNPDVLGYVSTALWHVPDSRIPHYSSALDADARSKLLRRLKIRFGDVKASDPSVGRLGIGLADTVEQCQKGRLYE